MKPAELCCASLLVLSILPGCDPAGTEPPGPVTAGSCLQPSGMASVSERLDATDACGDRIRAIQGRSVGIGIASGAIWTRRTTHGTGIVVTAAHVQSPCADAACVATLWDPEKVDGSAIAAISRGGGPRSGTLNAIFPLFHEAVPAAQ